MTDLQETKTLLNEVIDRWPDLAISRFKGTARVIAATTRRPAEQLEEGEGFGSVPAPVHLDVLDAIAAILDWAYTLHEHVAQTIGHDRLTPPVSIYANPRPYLEFVRDHLPGACDDDHDMLEAVHDTTHRIKSLIFTKIGEVFDGQELEALCPFCLGQTFKRLFGERTMRVRLVESRVREGELEPVVLCENPDGCRPFAVECDMWVGSKPAWPLSRWGWLAERLLPIPKHAA